MLRLIVCADHRSGLGQQAPSCRWAQASVFIEPCNTARKRLPLLIYRSYFLVFSRLVCNVILRCAVVFSQAQTFTLQTGPCWHTHTNTLFLSLILLANILHTVCRFSVCISQNAMPSILLSWVIKVMEAAIVLALLFFVSLSLSTGLKRPDTAKWVPRPQRWAENFHTP